MGKADSEWNQAQRSNKEGPLGRNTANEPVATAGARTVGYCSEIAAAPGVLKLTQAPLPLKRPA